MGFKYDARKPRPKDGNLRDHLPGTRTEISSLYLEVTKLNQTCESFHAIRRRSYAVHGRDIKGMLDDQGWRDIIGGNAKACNGDAVADAAMFWDEARTDGHVYQD